jgi:hypothetical protein
MPQVATAGSFKAGTSGNPGGRPSGSSRLQLAMLRLMDDAVGVHTKILWGDFSDPKIAALQFAAAREVYDRGFGRAAQTIAMDVGVKEMLGERKLSELSTDELIELRRRVAMATMAAPAIVEATAEPASQDVQLDLIDDPT